MSSAGSPFGIINLSSYSDTDGYVGYYERKSAYSDAAVDAALGHFRNFLVKAGRPNLLVATCLYMVASKDVLKREYGFSREEIESYIEPLVRAGVLMQGDEPECAPSISNFRFFTLEGDDVEIVEKAIQLIMKLGGVVGHFFIFFEESRLIVYPHDGAGFGFISLSGKRQAVMDFLTGVDDRGFDVVLKK